MKVNKFRKKLEIIIPIIILVIISLLNMYGAKYISSLYANAFKRQLIWVIISLILFIITYKVNIRFLFKYSKVFYIVGNIILFLVLIFGTSVNGSKAWFKLGDLSVQPSEIFKFFFLIELSLVASQSVKEKNLIIKIILLTLIPSILIFLEPDTGVVIMYLLMMLGELLASPIKKRYLIVIFIVVVILLGLFITLYFTNQDLFINIFGTSFFYRMDRLINFKESSYQLDKALTGLSSAGLFGFGLTDEKVYVPEITTDFVFTLTIFNFGYLGGIFVIFVFSYIFVKLYKEIKHQKKKVYKYILSATLSMMMFEVIEAVFMNLGLTPITGITLPFLSYGGSSLVSYAIIFAIIIKITF